MAERILPIHRPEQTLEFGSANNSVKCLPLEVQENIIKRLSLKPLIQCRSVSKTWKSLIDSSRFISEYNARNKQHLQHHLLVRYDPHENICERTYVSVVDDDNNTFPNQRVSVTEPALVNMLTSPAIIGSSHGLVCVHGYYRHGGDITTMAVIWNISIRKAVAVVVPNVADVKQRRYRTFVDFGVCRETNDPKIVKITQIKRGWKDMESVNCIPYQVEVFTLSTGAWRSPCSNLLSKSIQFGCRQGVEGFCYWLATDMSVAGGGLESYNLIVSFDLTSEEFTKISLPDNLVYYQSHCTLYISNIRESLVVLDCGESEWDYNVWRMEDGVPKSFTKLFTICAPSATILRVLGFRKSGEPIMEIAGHPHDPYDGSVSVVVYGPNSKHISSIGFDGIGSFFVYPYKETLLLLDQPEFTVYDNGKGYIAKKEVF
ncbi:F-box protein CPR1-like [Bidens hawaiensis]|uniref:F-box protein CPR1-like n=1 Tax=Bidens hawaiensis TaxID=980011 RepID=UPI00404935DA